MAFKDTADIIWILVVLVLSGAYVAWGADPPKTKAAQVGGIAFLLWLLVQVGKFLFTHG